MPDESESASFRVISCNRTHHAPQHSAPGVRDGNCHIRLLASGHGWYYDGQQRTRISGSQVLILDGRDRGHVVCDQRNPYDFIFMGYNGGEARRLTDAIIARYGNLFPMPNRMQTLQLCRRMYHLPRARSRFALIDALLAELLVSLLHDEEHSAPALHFRQIHSWLENHLQQQLRREDLAQVFEVHPLTIDRICKNACGKTVRQLHEELRMQLACSLLSDRQMNVSEVALRIGFDDQFHFSRVFKKHHGQSPKQYQLSAV